MLSMDRSLKSKTHQRLSARVKTLSLLFSMRKPMPAVCGARQTRRADTHYAIVLFFKFCALKTCVCFTGKTFGELTRCSKMPLFCAKAFQGLQLAWLRGSVLDFLQGLFAQILKKKTCKDLLNKKNVCTGTFATLIL